MASLRCKTCGVMLDEIPFSECAEHRAYEAAQPPLTQQELNLALEAAFDDENF